jgi:hypothetical protein
MAQLFDLRSTINTCHLKPFSDILQLHYKNFHQAGAIYLMVIEFLSLFVQ